jgi:REP element-mobilizing transposase RayT
MAKINKDNPCLFVTTVARNRLPVFRTDALKGVACRALDEARCSGGFSLFAYVIMPDHLHVVADGTLKASDTLRYLNGILSHRVIAFLKESGFMTSLVVGKATGTSTLWWIITPTGCRCSAKGSSCRR